MPTRLLLHPRDRDLRSEPRSHPFRQLFSRFRGHLMTGDDLERWPTKEAVKRQLMFVAGEDYYFLAYSLLILLSDVGAESSSKSLRDPRKAIYLADFIGNSHDVRLLELGSSALSRDDASRL